MANISLSNLAEIKTSGIPLALRKAINELFNRKKVVCPPKKDGFLKPYMPNLSVIICTMGTEKNLTNCINSVLSQKMPDTEIILVNNSTNKVVAPNGVKVINEPALGLSRARNTGARHAKGEYLLYMDDDAVADNNLLSVMKSAFEAHPKCAIIGGQIFLNLPTPTPKVFLKGKEALWSGYTVPYTKFKEIKEQYEFPYGACFGIRHSALDAMGGFPENYGREGNNFAGGEETALCFMALNYDMKIGIEPSAKVFHNVSARRFTKEHIKKTTYEGIVTTYRLFVDGYSPKGWTYPYIVERINIINAELARLSGLAAYYKRCELEGFLAVKKMISGEN